jgi:hypothetical protein
MMFHTWCTDYRLTKVLTRNDQKDFVQTILTDNHEVTLLKECADEMSKSIQNVIADLVGFTKVTYLRDHNHNRIKQSRLPLSVPMYA